MLNSSEFLFQLVTYPNPILNEESAPVTKDSLEDIKKMIKPMQRIMQEYGGVGLSAIQIGIKMRFCIIVVGDASPYDVNAQTVVTMINPEITPCGEQSVQSEGCLSLPLFKEPTMRYSKVTVKYIDLSWNEQTIDLEGTAAQCIQHEIGHMNGLLIVDNLSNMKKEMYTKKLTKARKHGKVRY